MGGTGLVKLGTAGFVVWFGIQYAGVLVKTKDSFQKSAAGVDLYSVDKFLQQYGALPDHPPSLPFPPTRQQEFEGILERVVEVHGERKPHEDQWGHRYTYTYLGPESYDIHSMGKDGKPDTEDDLLLTRRGNVVKLNIDLQKLTDELVDEELARKEEQAAKLAEMQQEQTTPAPGGDASSPAAGDAATSGADEGAGGDGRPPRGEASKSSAPGAHAAPSAKADGGADDWGEGAAGAPSKGAAPAPTPADQVKANNLLQSAKRAMGEGDPRKTREIYLQIRKLYPGTRAARQAGKALEELDNGP